MVREVHRCLKSSGKFIFYEAHDIKREPFDQILIKNGFSIIKKIDVTWNVLQSLLKIKNQYTEVLSKMWYLPKGLADFKTGASVSKNFEDKKRVAMIYVVQKC